MLVFTWRSMELEVAGQGPVGEHVLVQLHDLAQVSAGQVLHALSPWLYQHSEAWALSQRLGTPTSARPVPDTVLAACQSMVASRPVGHHTRRTR